MRAYSQTVVSFSFSWQSWFTRKPLEDDEKSLVIVCDPTSQRTLGEREAFLRSHPNFKFSASKHQKNKNASFKLVHQDLAQGIYHYAGALLPSSGLPTVEICFSFDTTGSMYELMICV